MMVAVKRLIMALSVDGGESVANADNAIAHVFELQDVNAHALTI